MAAKGSLRLANEAILNMIEVMESCHAAAQDAFYSQYKNTYQLAHSNHYRGTAADTFKQYLIDGEINLINGFLELTHEMTMTAHEIAAAFLQYESRSSGMVAEDALNYICDSLADNENVFSGAKSDLIDTARQAARYIAVKGLELDDVNAEYMKIRDALLLVREDLYDCDDFALEKANELYDKIFSLKMRIEEMITFCYTNGKLSDHIGDLGKQGWYVREDGRVLGTLLRDDPFSYNARHGAVAEDQWARGLYSDVYVYAEYSRVAGGYEHGRNNGVAYVSAYGSLAQASFNAQFTDYARFSADARAGYAEGEARAGFSDEYIGARAEGEVGLARVESSLVLGSDNTNAYIKVDANVLCADGKVAFEFEKDGQFAIGFDASATLASASAQGGISLLSFVDDSKEGNDKERLLGFSVEAKANAGGEATFWLESKTAIEGKHININATTIKLGGSFMIGANIELTIPTPYFKWPW